MRNEKHTFEIASLSLAMTEVRFFGLSPIKEAQIKNNNSIGATTIALEIAIQKIQQFTPEQQNKVIEFIEFLEFKGDRQQKKPEPDINTHPDQDFFELAGLWENKDITTEFLGQEA